jgi:hypothetical protein
LAPASNDSVLSAAIDGVVVSGGGRLDELHWPKSIPNPVSVSQSTPIGVGLGGNIVSVPRGISPDTIMHHMMENSEHNKDLKN